MAQLLKLKVKSLGSFYTLVILSLILFICVVSDDSDERDYMLRLMKALNPTPSNWSNKTDICTWRGVICDSGYIDRINLTSMSLTGILPPGLNNSLRSLTKLDLSNNSLSGPLPSLANLDQLHHVDLSYNDFTSIPDGCFQDLAGLQFLYLSNNTNLAPWKFPIHLIGSPVLYVLDLRASNLMGSIPDIFGSFPKLNILALSNNSLNGVLPKSFAGSAMWWLILNDQSYNNLSGTIEVLSSMTSLRNVQLNGNSFEGPIPDLSNCTHLQYLDLHSNRLTGVVPHSLMNLSNSFYVSLDHNYLQGPVPVFIDGTDVIVGDNSSNSFCLDHPGPCDPRVTTLLEIAAAFGYPIVLARSWRGNNPCKGWSFVACDGSKIRTVNLTKLNLTGTISPAFGNLTDLRNLYLGDNNLWGSIPEILATIPQLEVLDVSNNNLSGKIPKFSSKVVFKHDGNVLLVPSQANGTSSSASKPRHSLIAGASATSAGVILIVVALIIYNHKRGHSVVQMMMFKKTRTSIDNNFEDFIKTGSLALKKYSYSEIKKMTNSFSNKLGQGGYGIVYKASLTDGSLVAVKVLNESMGSGEEFINEVATISRTSHVNIVSLLGFCYEKNKRALIYEFMSNGSLDKFISRKGPPNAICDLDWNTLFQITISIARGLEYLHRGCNTRILHLDIKPQNILLDEDFCPKIADFGLAKICKRKESIVSMLGTRGTPGYIAPEVYCRAYGGVSHKSDVYSYGMLILDMVGGRKNYDNEQSYTSEIYFTDWIYKDLEQGNILTRYLVSTKEDNEIVMKIILVGLWCIQTSPLDRPSMSKVVEMLEGSLQSVSYPPKPILCSSEMSSLQFSETSQSNVHETNSMTS